MVFLDEEDIEHYVCDNCGDEVEEIYAYDGRELCLECMDLEIEEDSYYDDEDEDDDEYMFDMEE